MLIIATNGDILSTKDLNIKINALLKETEADKEMRVIKELFFYLYFYFLFFCTNLFAFFLVLCALHV